MKSFVTKGKNIMDRINRFATKHPVAFGFVVFVVYILLLFVSAMLATLWPGEETYGQVGGTIGRVASIAFLLVLLFLLGWLRSAGFASSGPWSTWLVTLLTLVYSIGVSAYAMAGNFNFRSTLPSLVITFIVTAAFLEEVVFRGVIMHAFVRAWDSTNRGLIKSVLVSSLFFGGLHILDFFSGRPLSNVILQGIEAFFLGIILASLVLAGKSIYPAVFFHALLNLAGYLNVTSKGIEETPSSWLIFSLLMLPLAIFGLYLLRGLPKRYSPAKMSFIEDPHT
jgi:membrane protease YdiL (CAAX protease family)